MQTTQSLYDSVILRNEEGLKKKNKVFVFILFLISPLLSLAIALKNYRSSWAKNVVWLFVTFYGYTLVISNEGMDANSYRDKFLHMAQAEVTLDGFIDILYDGESTYLDIVQPLLSFIVSRFTYDHRILFLTFAAVFGYFYSRNIWYLIEKAGPKLKKEAIPILITFAFIVGFWQINGFRMWTAAHIFFCGAISYIYEKQKRGLFLCFLSVFVHFSFVLPILIILFYSVARNRPHLYFWAFIATFFLREINLSAVGAILETVVPDALQGKVAGYTNEDYASKSGNRENWSWHARYYGKALRWVVIIFVSTIYFKGLKYLKTHESLYSLYCFSLLFLAIGSVVAMVPSGGRFVTIATLFAVASIFLYIQYAPRDEFTKRFIPLSIPALILYCVVALRLGFNTIGIMTVFGNPVVALFWDVEIALIEFIK